MSILVGLVEMCRCWTWEKKKLYQAWSWCLSRCLQKNPEEDSSGRILNWEPGHLLLTLCAVRSIEQLLPFFHVLSQVFNSKVTSRSIGHSGSPMLYPNSFPNKDIKMENQKTLSSKVRQKIEEMVEKDFLEGVIKTWNGKGQNILSHVMFISNQTTPSFHVISFFILCT